MLLDVLVSSLLRLVYFLRLEDVLLNCNKAKLAAAHTKRTTLTGGLIGIVQSFSLDVVVKTSDNTSAQGRLQCKTLQTWREAKFYQEMSSRGGGGGGQSAAVELGLPKVYHAQYSALLGEFCIVMERVEGSLLREKLGEQTLEAQRSATSSSPLGLLQPLYSQLAKFHAFKWNPNTAYLLANPWLRGAEWIKGEGARDYEIKLAFGREYYNKGKLARGHLLPARLKQRMEFALCEDKDNFVKMIHHLQTSPRCLSHGDFHAGNVIVSSGREDKENARYVFFDLSEIGVFNPVYDLAQLLLSDVDGRWYAEIAKPLLAVWYEELCTAAFDGNREEMEKQFTLQRAYEMMLEAGLNKWIYLMGILLGFSSVSDARIEFWASNLEHWIALLEAEEGFVPQSFLRV